MTSKRKAVYTESEPEVLPLVSSEETVRDAETQLRILTKAVKAGKATPAMASTVSDTVGPFFQDINTLTKMAREVRAMRVSNGKNRGKQLSMQSDDKAHEAFRIYAEVIKTTAPRHAIAKTARRLQKSGILADVRQVRRWIRRVQEKRGSS